MTQPLHRRFPHARPAAAVPLDELLAELENAESLEGPSHCVDVSADLFYRLIAQAMEGFGQVRLVPVRELEKLLDAEPRDEEFTLPKSLFRALVLQAKAARSAPSQPTLH